MRDDNRLHPTCSHLRWRASSLWVCPLPSICESLPRRPFLLRPSLRESCRALHRGPSLVSSTEGRAVLPIADKSGEEGQRSALVLRRVSKVPAFLFWPEDDR